MRQRQFKNVPEFETFVTFTFETMFNINANTITAWIEMQVTESLFWNLANTST